MRWNYEEESRPKVIIIWSCNIRWCSEVINFTSVENNANEIIEYIDNNYNGNVKLIGGLH